MKFVGDAGAPGDHGRGTRAQNTKRVSRWIRLDKNAPLFWWSNFASKCNTEDVICGPLSGTRPKPARNRWLHEYGVHYIHSTLHHSTGLRFNATLAAKLALAMPFDGKVCKYFWTVTSSSHEQSPRFKIAEPLDAKQSTTTSG